MGHHAASASRRVNTRRAASLGGRLLAVLLSLTLFVVSGYAWASYHTFVSNVRTVNAIPSTPAGQARHDIDGAAQNILLVGDDDRTGATPAELAEMHAAQDGGGVNTDTLMVLHIPANGANATGISIPRDSWVNIPGFGMNKINAAYEFGTQNGGGASGGAQLLITVVQNLTGLTINHYVAVSMLGFLKIAEVLGPIQVCLNEAAVDSYSGTNLPAGVSTLDPAQALAFVRQRHNLPRGDLDREVRQQYFLSTELKKVTSAGTLLNPIKLENLLRAVSSSLVTDQGLAGSNLISFAEQMQNLTAGNVKYATIPITGTPDIYPGGTDVSIVAVDYAAMPAFITKVIGEPASYTSATTVAPSSVRVDVFNGSDVQGLATDSAQALTARGFAAAVDPANFATKAPDVSNITSMTTIQYPAGMADQAKTLAAAVPGATVVQSASVRMVTLTLGTDNVRVKPATQATGSSSASSVAPAPAPTATAAIHAAANCIN